MARMVLVAPDGDRLPTRAEYNHTQPISRSKRRRPPVRNVAISQRSDGPAQWITYPDALASKLGADKTPTILRSIRFHSGPPQEDLQPIDVAGNPDYRIDPYLDPLPKRLVELRADLKTKMAEAMSAGDIEAVQRFDGLQRGAKTAANAVGYGNNIETNPTSHRKHQTQIVHLPDNNTFESQNKRTDHPGVWFHPLIGTLTAAGGRLLLALAMRLLRDIDGSYVFCDTDSLFIPAKQSAASDVEIPTLAWDQITEVADRFESLNPYDRRHVPGSILKIENLNYDITGELRTIECFAIASKRYALFTRTPDGRPEIVSDGDERKRSEHGLGHLLPPKPQSTNPEPTELGWKDEWWDQILHLELGLPHPEPDWFDLPAIGQLTITNPDELALFKTHNKDKPYPDQIKPFNFLITAHPHRLEGDHEAPGLLFAPYNRNPNEWLTITDWRYRNKPDPQTLRIRTRYPEYDIPGSVAVKTYRQYFDDYTLHPETKAAGADGQPCQPWATGLLQPRHIRATDPFARIGKETNRLADNPATNHTEDGSDYPESPRCDGCNEPLTGRKRKWCSEKCRKRPRN
jgi:hypothetical protein